MAFRGERIINLRSGGVPKRSRAVTSNPRGSRPCFGGSVANYPGKLSAANFNVIKHTDKHRTLLLISRQLLAEGVIRRCPGCPDYVPRMQKPSTQLKHQAAWCEQLRPPTTVSSTVRDSKAKKRKPSSVCVCVCVCMFKTIPGAAGFFVSNVFAAFTR